MKDNNVGVKTFTKKPPFQSSMSLWMFLSFVIPQIKVADLGEWLYF